MKIALLQLAIAGLSYGYVVRLYGAGDCSGAANVLDLASNGKCTGVSASSSVSYQSDIGCVLSTYDSENCGGQKAVTRSQNTCFSPGYQIRGVICA